MSNRRARNLVTLLSGGAAAAWTPAAALPSGATAQDWFKSNTGLYKDAGKTQACAADTDLIYTWDNLAAGNDFVQATEANRPSLAIVAGAHFLKLDGSDDFMAANISADASQTVFIIYQSLIAPDATTRRIWSFGGSANAQFYLKTTAPSGLKWGRAQDTTQVSLGGTVTNLNYLSFTFTDAATAAIRLNGGAPVSFDPDDAYSLATILTLGNSAAPSNGYLMEFIRFTSPLSDADRAIVEAYLATRVANPT